ncbi:MAG: Kae1-associated serine/threonine protein kinase [Candidatus Marsarchaeota archaeon]|nr:Kae1-associated serine/threonine protein kinase [Candidatus Marsarchaeota archaeon]
MALKKISEGAEADIYGVDFFGIKSILKYRRPKPYLIKEIEEPLRSARTRSEARILARASSITKAPRLLFVSKYGIIMEKINGINASEKKGLGLNGASEAGDILSKLHAANIVHGDFTKANLIFSNSDSSLYVIDFGLSYNSNSAEDLSFDLLLFKRSVTRPEYAKFEISYSRGFKRSKEVFQKLSEIEKRGRYQNRSLDTAE